MQEDKLLLLRLKEKQIHAKEYQNTKYLDKMNPRKEYFISGKTQMENGYMSLKKNMNQRKTLFQTSVSRLSTQS